MDGKIKTLLTDLKGQLQNLYGARLRGLFLFGSYARGEADEESDVDVLIVLDRIDDYSSEIRRSSQVISDLSLKYGVTVSRVFASEEKWRRAATLFFLKVREEAVAA